MYTVYKEKIYILLIREPRDDKIAYNFVGGKREYRRETPLKCALREMKEELAKTPPEIYNSQMLTDISQKYLWYSPGKYFLIPIRIEIQNLVINQEYKWIAISEVLKELLHPFAREIIKTFKLAFPVGLYK